MTMDRLELERQKSPEIRGHSNRILALTSTTSIEEDEDDDELVSSEGSSSSEQPKEEEKNNQEGDEQDHGRVKQKAKEERQQSDHDMMEQQQQQANDHGNHRLQQQQQYDEWIRMSSVPKKNNQLEETGDYYQGNEGENHRERLEQMSKVVKEDEQNEHDTGAAVPTIGFATMPSITSSVSSISTSFSKAETARERMRTNMSRPGSFAVRGINHRNTSDTATSNHSGRRHDDEEEEYDNLATDSHNDDDISSFVRSIGSASIPPLQEPPDCASHNHPCTEDDNNSILDDVEAHPHIVAAIITEEMIEMERKAILAETPLAVGQAVYIDDSDNENESQSSLNRRGCKSISKRSRYIIYSTVVVLMTIISILLSMLLSVENTEKKEAKPITNITGPPQPHRHGDGPHNGKGDINTDELLIRNVPVALGDEDGNLWDFLQERSIELLVAREGGGGETDDGREGPFFYYQNELNDVDSPQYKAYQWLAEDQNYYGSSSIMSQKSQNHQKDSSIDYYFDSMLERYSLVALYYATDGDNWIQKDGWLNHSLSQCDWQQTTTLNYDDGSEPKYPVVCVNSWGFSVLEGLSLSQNNLVGSLPNELAFLKGLHRVQLTNNNVTGTLPAALGNVDMRRFQVERNPYLSGTLPVSFGAWTNLGVFRISSTSISGTIPQDYDSWVFATEISFDDTRLTGSVPLGICDFDNLKSLSATCDLLECGCCTYCCVADLNCTSTEYTLTPTIP